MTYKDTLYYEFVIHRDNFFVHNNHCSSRDNLIKAILLKRGSFLEEIPNIQLESIEKLSCEIAKGNITIIEDNGSLTIRLHNMEVNQALSIMRSIIDIYMSFAVVTSKMSEIALKRIMMAEEDIEYIKL